MDAEKIKQLAIASGFASAHAGNIPTAVNILQSRHDADVKAGHDDGITPLIIQGLQSSNPADVTSAKTMMANVFGMSLDPKEASGILKSLGVSQEPVVTKGGDTATNPLLGGSTTTQLPSVLATTKYPNGAEAQSFGNPNPSNQVNANGGAFGTPDGSGARGSTPVQQTPAGVPNGTPSAPTPGTASAIAARIGSNSVEGTARNPRSSAVGPGQFLNATWLQTYKKYMPTDGMSDSQILAQRTQNPAVARALLSNFTQDNMDHLSSVGISPTPTNTYLTHLFGRGGGPQLINAAMQNPSTPADQVISAAALKGNPQFKNMTVGQVAQYAQRKMQDTGQQVADNSPLSASSPGVDVGQPNQAGGAVAGPQGASGGGLAAGQIAAPVNPTPTGYVDTRNAEPGMGWNADHSAVVPVAGSSEDPASYPKSMLQKWAIDQLLGKTLPFQGTSGTAVKRVVAQIGSQIMQTNGLTPDMMNIIGARNKANENAYQPVTNQLSSLQSSEEALKANVQQVRNTAAVLSRLGVTHGSPFINAHMLELAEQGGSQEQKNAVQQYHTAINGVASEYAKFMSSSSGQSGSAPTDSMKHQADEVVNGHLSNGTLNAGMDQILTEAGNKRQSVAGQKAYLERKIADPLGIHGPPSNASALLRAHPQLRGQFDAKYGSGASADVLGN